MWFWPCSNNLNQTIVRHHASSWYSSHLHFRIPRFPFYSSFKHSKWVCTSELLAWSKFCDTLICRLDGSTQLCVLLSWPQQLDLVCYRVGSQCIFLNGWMENRQDCWVESAVPHFVVEWAPSHHGANVFTHSIAPQLVALLESWTEHSGSSWARIQNSRWPSLKGENIMSFVSWVFHSHNELWLCLLTGAPRYIMCWNSQQASRILGATTDMARTKQAHKKCQISKCPLLIESSLTSLWAVPFNYLDPCFVLLNGMSQIEYYLMKITNDRGSNVSVMGVEIRYLFFPLDHFCKPFFLSSFQSFFVSFKSKT